MNTKSDYEELEKWLQIEKKNIGRPVILLMQIASGLLLLFFLAWGISVFQGIFGDGESLKGSALLGDSFGVLNALFSALAFIIIALTLFQSQRDMRRQSAENHFLRFLESWQSVTDRLEPEAFTQFKSDMERRLYNCRNKGTVFESMEERKEWVRKRYDEVTQITQELGHYFRLLYHLIRYVHNNKSFSRDDRFVYVKIIRAHLSESEQFVLFYNSFHSRSHGMHEYIKTYHLLRTMEHGPIDNHDRKYYKELTGDEAQPPGPAPRIFA